MKLRFYRTGELNGSSYVKIPLKSNATLNIAIFDKYFSLWSNLAHVQPCDNSHLSRVKTYRQYFNEINIEGFDFSTGFGCSDVHKFEKLNTLSINIFKLLFYQDRNIWNYKLFPIEMSKNESDRVVETIINKNQYALIKKVNVSFRDHHKTVICKGCLNSFTSENMLTIHKPNCEFSEIATIETSSDSYFHWKDHFHMNPLYFRTMADFDADNEIDNFNISNETTSHYEKVLFVMVIISELNNALQSGEYESLLRYEHGDWFVDEIIKLENRRNFYFKNTKKDIIMTEEEEEDFQNINNCRFCEKNLNLINIEIIVT